MTNTMSMSPKNGKEIRGKSVLAAAEDEKLYIQQNVHIDINGRSLPTGSFDNGSVRTKNSLRMYSSANIRPLKLSCICYLTMTVK